MTAVATARIAALGLALTVAACRSLTPAAPLETITVAHGPFEIVAAGRRIGAGGFPNNGGNPFETIEVTSFRVRHAGQPVTVTHGASTITSFWRVVRLPDAPQPTLLASTTDFHLITDDQGTLVTRSFGDPSTDMAEYQWLDSEGGQPGMPAMFGIEQVRQQGMELRGGRWLRLSHHTILDVQTLRVFAIRPWIEGGKGVPLRGLNGGSVRAIALSPGQTQYVTIGYGYDYDGDGEHYEGLLVVDIPSGDAYGLPLDRKRTHYYELDDATPVWLEHYFRWTREPGGRERLVARPDAPPLPWTGRIVAFSAGDIEYRLRPVHAGMRAVLHRFLLDELHATVAPNWMDPKRDSDGTFRIAGCPGVVATGMTDDHVSLFVPSMPTGRPECMATVRRVAAAFDAELASGKYQELFVE